jgi:uncharacterized integral membrane protein
MADDRGATATRSRREWARLGGSVLLAGLAIAFAVLNLDDVDVNWIFGTWSTPLIVVIVLCLIVGVLLGRFALGRGSRR